MRTAKTTNLAIVLAGGRSSRMGRPKAILPFKGATIIERIVAELLSGFSEIVVVTGVRPIEQFKIRQESVKMIHDDMAFAGPVRALARALPAIDRGHAFVCSCDLPLIRVRVALELCAMLGRHDAVIPMIGGKLQMMHAVYHRRCAEVLSEMEQRGERRLMELAGRVSARIVDEDQLRRFDPTLESFYNVNTPADYAHALKLAESRWHED